MGLYLKNLDPFADREHKAVTPSKARVFGGEFAGTLPIALALLALCLLLTGCDRQEAGPHPVARPPRRDLAISADFETGKGYLEGTSAETNAQEAAKFFQRAAERGDFRAQGFLATLYTEGHGVPHNSVEAIRWWHQVAQNPDGVAWWKGLAERGDPRAEYFLGLVLMNGGAGIQPDVQRAVLCLRKAAELNYPAAQDLLGSCYEGGHGIGQDYQEAVRWFEKGAEQGYAESQHDLGMCLLKGSGTAKNPEVAMSWLRKAAEQGLSEAQYNLAIGYERGVGVPLDLCEALRWLKKAADQQDALAQVALGKMYAAGRGVPQDSAEAKEWFKKAAKNGYSPAEALLATLDMEANRKLSPTVTTGQ